MKELVVGSKFYHKGKLVEVRINTSDSCGECVFNAEKCKLVNCKAKYRHDETNVIYKEIEK